MIKPQRIRDSLHNLIEFGPDQFEQTLWRVIQTKPFQRLRRVRQLGFSELVYPGATHTRFAHSLGAFHTARNLMKIIKRHIESKNVQFKDHQAQVALAASLVHDVGHGMFSHAFEDVGKRMKLKMAEHEHVSNLLIRNGEICEAFSKELGSGFANDVADVIESGRPGNLYDAVVSSQFDADRLDYMQRDRLMTGVQSSGIDFVWLLHNLEVGSVPVGADNEISGEIDTFVLGPKAIHAAESYVVALFQLYPTVYYHKATRCAEKIFSELMVRIIEHIQSGAVADTGLPSDHPFVRFALDPSKIENALDLDDSVFWGALPMLVGSNDRLISQYSDRLLNRKLMRCIDVHKQISALIDGKTTSQPSEVIERNLRIERIAESVKDGFEEFMAKNKSANDPSNLLIDAAERHPYKRFQESKGPLNQISIRREGVGIRDMVDESSIIASLEPFKLLRIYCDNEDHSSLKYVDQLINEKVETIQ